ncbi:hypothetical protein HN832_01195 [archaeon]|jgi:hypothetical protein|nr:hypothetical protein [archaeon]MBT4373827.1 hypothetical protein [archaeon]MBT4532293.1 hypothetical protein [archaeon]MBT7001118.1 hypothetical protein [archaeon]MBT7282007.1 hypothetical protein [archaeon]
MAEDFFPKDTPVPLNKFFYFIYAGALLIFYLFLSWENLMELFSLDLFLFISSFLAFTFLAATLYILIGFDVSPRSKFYDWSVKIGVIYIIFHLFIIFFTKITTQPEAGPLILLVPLYFLAQILFLISLIFLVIGLFKNKSYRLIIIFGSLILLRYILVFIGIFLLSGK